MKEKRHTQKIAELIIALLLLLAVWGDSNIKPNALNSPFIRSDSLNTVNPPLPPFSRVDPMGGLDEGLGVTKGDEAQRIQQLRVEFPELAEVLEKTRRIAHSIRNAVLSYNQSDAPAEKNEWEKKIRELLQEEFDLEVERQYLEIEFLEKRIEKLKILIARFEKSQNAVLEYRLKKILRQGIVRKPLRFQPEILQQKKNTAAKENTAPHSQEITPTSSADKPPYRGNQR